MPNAASKARKRHEMEERRVQVAELWTLHLEQHEMAKKLGVSDATISRDVAWLAEQWRRRSEEEVGEIKACEIADLDAMERRLAIILTKRGENISAADLARLTDCRLHVKERRAKQLGLDAPAKSEVTGSDGGPVKVVVDHVGREEWSGT